MTRSGFMPGTAEATRWRIDWAPLTSSAGSVRTTTEAEGGCWSRRNEPRSGSTMWTRAAFTPFMPWMVRAISPSRARTRVTSCMNEVMPSEPRSLNSS